MTRLRSSCLLLLLLLLACARPPVEGEVDTSTTIRGRITSKTPTVEQQAQSGAGIELSAEPRGSSQVLLKLHNGSASSAGYNLCSSSLQRRSAAGWKMVPTGEICTMEIRDLQPGGSATFEKALPANVGSGEYRYVTSVERPEGRIETASNSFAMP